MEYIVPSTVTLTKELTQAMEESRLQVSHTLQSDGNQRYATPTQQIAAFNRRSNPEISSPGNMKWTTTNRDIVVDNDILLLNPGEECNFNIQFPYRRRELNIHSGPGGSITAIIADLKTIWEHVLTENWIFLLKT